MVFVHASMLPCPSRGSHVDQPERSWTPSVTDVGSSATNSASVTTDSAEPSEPPGSSSSPSPREDVVVVPPTRGPPAKFFLDAIAPRCPMRPERVDLDIGEVHHPNRIRESVRGHLAAPTPSTLYSVYYVGRCRDHNIPVIWYGREIFRAYAETLKLRGHFSDPKTEAGNAFDALLSRELRMKENFRRLACLRSGKLIEKGLVQGFDPNASRTAREILEKISIGKSPKIRGDWKISDSESAAIGNSLGTFPDPRVPVVA